MSSRTLRKLQNDDELLKSLVGDADENDANFAKPVPQTNIFALMNDENESESNEEENDINEETHDPVIIKEPKSAPERITLPIKTKKKANRRKNRKKTKQKNSQQEELEKTDGESDDDLERMIQQFRKKDVQTYGLKEAKYHENESSDNDEYETASEQEDEDLVKISGESSMHDLRYDSGFAKFPIKYMRTGLRFFNDDFKKLDPHFEFKMLFGDLTSESLDDIDSMTSTHVSPQQLKQIQRMKRLLKNWGGKDHKSVPNGPGLGAHRLKFTKVQEDWLPTPRGELMMQKLSADDILNWQLWQRRNDWKDVIEENLADWEKFVTYYKFEPLSPDANKKGMTDFYMSVVLHPDHEALINLISSKYPYHVPALLQVALIMVRQGDRSNTNGLLQRALFVFDRALKSTINFDSLSCQLPYIYFFNRQFYLAIFRYILTLAQRGAMGTASEWCKVLWSLSPLEDPIGCRYFIDHYLLLNSEFHYLIGLSRSSLTNVYKQWYTLGISLGAVLSYLHIDDYSAATKELAKAFEHHPYALSILYKEKFEGTEISDFELNCGGKESDVIELKAYMARFSSLWKNTEHLNFLSRALKSLLRDHQRNLYNASIEGEDKVNGEMNPFFIDGIPINLLRFAVLSEESSVMASIPQNIWSDHEVFDFDVLPPKAETRESIDTIETIKSFINERDLLASQVNVMQDEDLLNQIRQMSLEEYLENAGAGEE